MVTHLIMESHPLRLYRERHNPPLTQEQLAALLGTTKATVSRWESGKRVPKTRDLPRIAELTGIHPEELIPEAI